MFVKQPTQKTHTETQRIVKTYKYCLASIKQPLRGPQENLKVVRLTWKSDFGVRPLL